MILFVFEGNEREPRLYRTLERLYFPRENDNIICSFGNNIYELYNEHDFRLLQYGLQKGISSPVNITRTTLLVKLM